MRCPSVEQACEDFLDELLAQEAGGEGRVPDIRLVDPSSTSMLDFGIKVSRDPGLMNSCRRSRWGRMT